MRVLCVVLHAGLIVLHLFLLVVWATHLEHKMVFSALLQKKISTITKATMTMVATIYLAAIVFVTQKLANQCNLKKYTTLTATHDNLLSWSGIGSALNNLYLQFSLPASVVGTLSVVGYLGLIMVIHTTTPALFSVPIFNISTSSVVPTLGVPQWNQPVAAFMDNTIEFLPWIRNLEDTLGLFNGSLYDVLQDTNLGNGSAEVSVTGFNITCGYLPGRNTHVLKASGGEPPLWKISFNSQVPPVYLLSSGMSFIPPTIHHSP
ncbi:hypothetical protein DFH08DRAFT_698808 [Mycena albidolilacea]|uniref:Uncharacterized protein n=1 Tax=Mycena albidolilacea TaxID=1033008 RepID=A0AAD7ERT5_9AGAR|nr:hypothetical protein DFH08DRAFT_698808 [Mycena albidolilacea]